MNAQSANTGYSGTPLAKKLGIVAQSLVRKKQLVVLRGKLRADAALWVSWPKKASKQPTDITEDIIRKLALPLGFVDIKVCAVDEIWSGLKLVVRKELR